jgi:poly(hydroxyalkanoate) depolymerase family esterase
MRHSILYFSVEDAGMTGTDSKIVAGLAAALLWSVVSSAVAQALSQVSSFGSNPGNLRMFKQVPVGLPANSPLVVALHGCTQSASSYDNETGWAKFAEKAQFALLLPEQQRGNNQNLCFNWFQPNDTRRNQGEALSIKQMIDKMKMDHAIDPKRVYVTGLSAGGAMTAVMLATYPEVFDAGAIVAGLPYQCATGTFGAFSCMSPGKNQSADQWGTLVRNASSHRGPWPRVSIWQGTADTTVAPMNAAELVDQWTNVNGIDQTPDGHDTVNGQTHQVFKNTNGKVLVESYMIANMGHGTPIAPGPGEEQCGTAAPFILDAGICSSFHIAKFWGLIASSTGTGGSTADREQLLKRIERCKGTWTNSELPLRKA